MKTLRIANASHHAHLLTAKTLQTAALATVQRHGIREPAMKDSTACKALAAIQQYRIDCSQTAGWLTQRSCRQHPPVAQASLTINNGNLDIACQRVVLKSVIGNDQINTLGQQALSGSNPVRTDAYRHTGPAPQQQRLIANFGGIIIRLHQIRCRARSATISTTDDSRHKTRCAAGAYQPVNYRRLAGAPNGDIADHNDRYRQSLWTPQSRLPEPATQLYCEPE
jgi:hypothetical protein